MVQHTKPRSDLHQQSISLTSKKNNNMVRLSLTIPNGRHVHGTPMEEALSPQGLGCKLLRCIPQMSLVESVVVPQHPILGAPCLPVVSYHYSLYISLYIFIIFTKKTDDIPIIAGYFIFPRFVGNRTQYILKISGLLIYPQYMAIAQ